MTAFNISQIPTSIVTLEQLAAFSSLALASTFPSLKISEGLNYQEFAASANFYTIDTGNATSYRLIARVSLPVNVNFKSGGLKSWNYVQELGNTPLPNFVLN